MWSKRYTNKQINANLIIHAGVRKQVLYLGVILVQMPREISDSHLIQLITSIPAVIDATNRCIN